MRAFFTSSSASLKLRNERVVPIMTSFVMVKRVRLPNSFGSTAVAAPHPHEWRDGYSGCPGVANSGVHAASTAVAEFQSVSALRMAVMGRQKLYVYFASQHAMAASAIAMFIAASSRA